MKSREKRKERRGIRKHTVSGAIYCCTSTINRRTAHRLVATLLLLVDDLVDLRIDVVTLFVGVYGGKDSLSAVIIHHRHGFLVIHSHPLLHRLLLVILPLDQGLPRNLFRKSAKATHAETKAVETQEIGEGGREGETYVILARNLRGIEVLVIGPSAGLVDQPSTQACNHNGIGDLKLDRTVEFGLVLLQHLVQL